jgi:hypothetical protein
MGFELRGSRHLECWREDGKLGGKRGRAQSEERMERKASKSHDVGLLKREKMVQLVTKYSMHYVQAYHSIVIIL